MSVEKKFKSYCSTDSSTTDSIDNDNSPKGIVSEEQLHFNKNHGRSTPSSSKGLTVMSAAIFIAGEMGGSGVLALPRAVVEAGWIGLLLIVYFCISAAYCGTRLGACWSILEERYPEYRGPVRNPYAAIAYRAVGKKTSVMVSSCMQFTLFGASPVYLLLASQIVQKLLQDMIPNISFCVWFLAIALLVCPAMWLGSPKDFRLVGIGAIVTITFACILLFAQITIDGVRNIKPVEHEVHGFKSFFLAFGTILFSFGGASTFPTIQNDMVQKSKFSYSVLIGFTVVLALYMPIAVGGYLVYGEAVNVNIALNVSNTILILIANILMAIHLVLAFLIIINPVCQELEELFHVPHNFNWKRCLLRTIMLCVMVFVGETIPQFGKILSLVGGSTITLLIIVFPSIFYMRLCDQTSSSWPQRYIPLYIRVYLWELILMGIVGGTASTYSAVSDIFGRDSLTRPCYVHSFIK